MLILGIDPGLSGGIAAITQDGDLIAVSDLPVIRDGKLSWIDGGELRSWILALPGDKRVIVERVTPMPKQGLGSTFNFGVGFGSLLGTVQSLGLPIELVTSGVWKGALGLSRDKRASLDRARLLYPSADLTLAKHEGRAESILIAHWAQRRHWSKAA
jgi:crossover junction endodeoxyribonuclease RuvC